MLIHLGVKEQTVFTSYAKFTLHDFSPDFNSLTGFAKLLTNARNQRLVHASDNHAVWIIKDAIWENRPLNIWHAKYVSGPASNSKSCCMKWVLTEKYISDDLQPMREHDTGQWEVRGGVIWNFTPCLPLMLHPVVVAVQYYLCKCSWLLEVIIDLIG